MGKRFVAVSAIALFFCFTCTARAESVDSLHIEQVYAQMPYIEAYVYKSNADNEPLSLSTVQAQGITARYGATPLTVDSVSANSASTAYFYLLDISGSISQTLVEEMKAAVSQHINTLPSTDKLAVVTFGEGVKLVCEPQDNAQAALDKVQQIKAGENATRLYDGVSEIAEYISTNDASLPHRRVVLLVTDGADVYQGGATQNEVLQKLNNAGLAMYSFGVENSKKQDLDNLAELARASGGRHYALQNGKALEVMANARKFIENVMCVYLAAENNLVTNNLTLLQLDMLIGDKAQSVQKELVVSKWQKDTTMPSLSSVEVIAENKLSLSFSEAVSIQQGVDAISIYSADGTQILISSITWHDKANAELLLSEKIYNASYVISVNGGTDISMESNKLKSELAFTVSTNNKDFAYFYSRYFVITAITVAAVALILTSVIIYHKLRRRKVVALRTQAEQAFEQHKISIAATASKKLVLHVAAAGHDKHKLAFELKGTLIIGRSNKTSDVAFDDSGLSRQHCALLLDNDRVLIKDLDSANGTYVNGICLKAVRELHSKDKITVSDTEITIEIL